MTDEVKTNDTPASEAPLDEVQVRPLTAEEIKAEKKAADEELHRVRLDNEHAHLASLVGRYYIGSREIDLLRKAGPEDVGYSDSDACSVVRFHDSGVEVAMPDSIIRTSPPPLNM